MRRYNTTVTKQLDQPPKNISVRQMCQMGGHKHSECGAKKQLCKYCPAMSDDHSSSDFPYLNVPEEHRCFNCKNAFGHNSRVRDLNAQLFSATASEPAKKKKYSEAKARVQRNRKR